MKESVPRLVRRAGLLAITCCLSLASCTTADVQKTTGSSLRGSSARVSVKPDTTELDTETLRWYRENGGNAKIAEAIDRQLSELPTSKTSDKRFEVTVVSFRLRSTQQQFWAGVLNGPDHITADIVEFHEGRRVNTFRANASNNATMYAGLSAAGRLEDMAKKLAQALGKQL